MKTTITIGKEDIERLVRNYLRAQGYDATGPLTYNVTAAYSDNRESWPASLNSITINAAPTPKASTSTDDYLRHMGY